MSLEDSLYLKHLRFDQRLKNWAIAKYYANTRLLVLIMICLLVAGMGAFFALPRQLNPDVELAIVSVTTVLPGASPIDVENLITTKIENEITNIPNIDVMSSQSLDSVSAVSVQFLGNVDPDKALDEVRQKVDLVNDLPDDAQDPVVQKLDFNDQPVWQLAIYGSADRLSISRVGKVLEEAVEKESSVRKVDLSGNEEEEIGIVLKENLLQQYGVSHAQIVQSLRTNDINFPAGSIEVGKTQYTLTIDNELQTVEDVRSIPITAGQQQIPLNELADVFIQSKEMSTPTFIRVNGERKPAVLLNVYKTTDATINGTYEAAKKVIEDRIQDYPQVQWMDVLNFAKETNKSFDDLQGNFINSILLVFIALTIFLGARQALIAAISLPLTLMCTFIIMGITGISLSFLAVFSLLLAISLIGDDAIVIVQSSKQYMKKFPPHEAVLMVFRDFFIPIWTGTLTVVWSFVPLLLASGIIGKFIRPIPIVVTATLLSSTLIATLINLPLNAVFAQMQLPKRLQFLLGLIVVLITSAAVFAVVQGSPLAAVALALYVATLLALFFMRKSLPQTISAGYSKATKRVRLPGRLRQWMSNGNIFSKPMINVSPLELRYKRVVENIIRQKRKRWSVYAAVVAAIVISGIFLGTGLLKTEFFPKFDSTQLFVNIEGPAGWQQFQTEQVLAEVERRVEQYPEINHSIVRVGSQVSQSFDAGGSGDNTASLTLLLKEPEDRDRTSSEIAEDLRNNFSDFNQAKVTIAEESGGPPAGADFQANIKGEDLVVLEQISKDFQAKLATLPGVTNIDSSLKLSAGQIQVDLIPTELAERGLSAVQVGDWLRTVLTGSDVGEITLNGTDVDLTVSVEDKDRTISQLQQLTLPSQFGSYTLSEVAVLNLQQSPTSIVREGGVRVVRVTGGVTAETTAPEVLTKFNELMKEYEMPDGYTWDVGGVNEENQRSVNSILRAMGFSFVLILVTMVLLLNSFRQAFLVLLIIPVAISGVFINFTIFGIPLSFPALIGVLALFGIVVNNAIMLMDKINQNMHEGFPLYKGVADACASRIEPIFLTAVTGILGLLPITLADPLWRGLGGAIVAGLSVSGVFVLFLIPSLYVEVFGKELLKQEKKSSKTAKA